MTNNSKLAKQLCDEMGIEWDSKATCATVANAPLNKNELKDVFINNIRCNDCIHNDYGCRNNTNNNICEEFEWW